jgi:hypothetical protein
MPSAFAGQDRPARRFQHALLGHLGAAHRVEQLDGRGGVARPVALLGAQDAAFGDRRPHLARRGGHGRAGEKLGESAGRGAVADPAQRHGRGRGDFRIRAGQFLRQEVNRLRVAAHADRIDDADQQPALQPRRRLAQRLVGGRIGNRLQGDARPGGQLLVGQQGRERRNGVPVAEPRQVLAGDGFLRPAASPATRGPQSGSSVFPPGLSAPARPSG